MWVPHSLSGPQRGSWEICSSHTGAPGRRGPGPPQAEDPHFRHQNAYSRRGGWAACPHSTGQAGDNPVRSSAWDAGRRPPEGGGTPGHGHLQLRQVLHGWEGPGDTPAPEGGDLTGLRGLQGPGEGTMAGWYLPGHLAPSCPRWAGGRAPGHKQDTPTPDRPRGPLSLPPHPDRTPLGSPSESRGPSKVTPGAKAEAGWDRGRGGDRRRRGGEGGGAGSPGSCPAAPP